MDLENNIDWPLISRAIDYYEDWGYKYKEVPWVASYEAMKVTSPKNSRLFSVDLNYLVASAEQSFVQMMIDNELYIPGKYVAATPCFRDDNIDFFHRRYFFKVELIEVFSEPIKNKSREIKRIANLALEFMHEHTGNHRHWNTENFPTLFKTKEGLDITINDIEVGSYGYRKYKNFYWLYGTGIAEPRFSQSIMECGYSYKYKGKIKPKCLDGKGCGKCWVKYYKAHNI